MIRARITGTGAYAPEEVVTNDDLSKRIDTTDEWIHSRTGIRQRRVARADEQTSDMAAAAAEPRPRDGGPHRRPARHHHRRHHLRGHADARLRRVRAAQARRALPLVRRVGRLRRARSTACHDRRQVHPHRRRPHVLGDRRRAAVAPPRLGRSQHLRALRRRRRRDDPLGVQRRRLAGHPARRTCTPTARLTRDPQHPRGWLAPPDLPRPSTSGSTR
jgi:hypothetical protein